MYKCKTHIALFCNVSQQLLSVKDRHHRTGCDPRCSLNWALYSVNVKVTAINTTFMESGLDVLSIDVTHKTCVET